MSSGPVTWDEKRQSSLSLPQFNLRFRLLRFICNKISDLFFLVFVYAYPYRKEVILKNLKIAFPGLSAVRYNELLNAYYRHMADLLTEPFLIGFCKKRDLNRLVRYENAALVKGILDSGKDVVLMASHYGNWEYMLSMPMVLNGKVLTAFSTVSNSWLNNRLKKMRGKYGMGMIPKQDWYRASLKCDSSEPTVFIAVADQRPVGVSKETVHFFDQKTYIQCGAARLAKQRNAVMVYLDVKKQGRNVYSYRFVQQSALPGTTDVNSMMMEYYSHLEKTIARQPELWLWSHNRWKFNQTTFQPAVI
ncbi:lysophospholipid acyltransferase family protein [Dyadobacter sp. CY312]|uniref:lysophospholipid acyltransferase family protein n=1 Tax=Dyadobacter sp. CY312 TaxID=2907303 RepID=UPI001F2AF7E1|nr:lysophospholipid acyltransferase family protein [Dyadobacter sp. CY312]MCE7043201.1 lysophospholipid acyltransferase family protein [Dyadobacter sp. CY312]